MEKHSLSLHVLIEIRFLNVASVDVTLVPDLSFSATEVYHVRGEDRLQGLDNLLWVRIHFNCWQSRRLDACFPSSDGR
jgi:hypothetical protein